MRLSILIFGFLIINFILSCKKEQITQSKPTYQFPTTIGSTWEYSLEDTSVNIYNGKSTVSFGKVSVKIIGEKTLVNGKKSKIWLFNYPDKNDTLYSCLSNDSLIFYYEDGKYLGIKYGFILPFKVGNEWELGWLKYKVASHDTLNLASGIFLNTFHVKEFENQGNVYGWNDYFIDPGVGIVKYHYGTGVTLTEINHKIGWELISYKINSE